MTDNNQFQPYRYQQSDENRPSLNISASRSASAPLEPEGGIGALIRRPLVATAALLVTAGIFAAVLIFSYPDSHDAGQDVPIIKADAEPMRGTPEAAGGMTIANADSTIFQQMRTSNLTETPPVENLLDLEQPVSKDEVLASANPATLETPSSVEKSDAPAGEVQSDNTTAPEVVAAVQPVETPAAAPAEAKALQEPVQTAAAQPAPALQAPASSPETLAFVRSVLDKDKQQEAGTPAAATPTAAQAPAPAQEVAKAAEEAAAVQPAAGTPNVVKEIEKGTHYVQLASVSSAEGAEKEWGKIKKEYASLASAEHRVKSADLGAKGIFYRIQAGPFSKDKANEVCQSIKAQKPGGCLVVQ